MNPLLHPIKSVTMTQLYVHDKRLTMGELTVEVVKCSRLPDFGGASKIYCTLGVGQLSDVSCHVSDLNSKVVVIHFSYITMETDDSLMENTMASSRVHC